MYSVPIAYLLWFFSGCGVLGLHRFYLGKIGTGILYFCTGGLAAIGAIVDFFNLPNMVREANLRLMYREALYGKQQPQVAIGPQKTKESVERVILRSAKSNTGTTTPSEIALEADLPIEEAQKHLDKLVSKGFAEMRIRKSGGIVYCFPDFMDSGSDFEDI